MQKQNNGKLPLVAIIREAECIGCTKCIQACPADAILGSSKLMHTVIIDECIGCELCIAPCPVDCIDMVPLANSIADKSTRLKRAAHFKNRYRARSARLTQASKEQAIVDEIFSNKKSYIQAALERAKLKKKK
jgi:electron transport complex protein RnfB